MKLDTTICEVGVKIMKRIRNLELYQKSLLVFIIGMAAVFTVLYLITLTREGFAYMDTILVPAYENDYTLYSGRIQGTQACFTVYPDKTVDFQYGDKTYGPYTAREDSSAIPRDVQMRDSMTGVELLREDEIFFRGGVLAQGDLFWVYGEDGSTDLFDITSTANIGTVTVSQENGTVSAEPFPAAILFLMSDPEPVHKGNWLCLLGGLLLCVVAALSIVFADELFRWHLSFRIQDADQTEPSDWEMTRRRMAWTATAIVILVLFIMGLG